MMQSLVRMIVPYIVYLLLFLFTLEKMPPEVMAKWDDAQEIAQSILQSRGGVVCSIIANEQEGLVVSEAINNWI